MLMVLLVKFAETPVSHLIIQKELWADHDTALKKRNIAERIKELKRQLPEEVACWISAVFGEGYLLKKDK